MSAAFFRRLPTLTTERLTLRPLRREDAADMFAYASDPEMAHYTLWEAHRTLADTRQFLTYTLACYERGEPASWGVVLTATGRLIGTCGFVGWNMNHRRGEIGYAIARALWGQGLATEAARAVVDFGFRATTVYRLQALCMVENTASARVMEKLGMHYEGILRGFMVHKGHPSDMKMYATLRNDWDERPSESAETPPV